MANLILPRRFTQQPQYPVEIDHNNPLTSGLVLTFSGAVLHDGVTGKMLTVTGSPRQEPRDGDVSLYTSASADVLSLAIPAIATSEPVTVVSRSSCSVYNSTRKRVWRAAGASYGTQFAEDYSNGSLSARFLTRQTSTGSYQDATLSSGAINANSWYDSKCSHSGGTAPSVMDIGWTSGSSSSGNRREAITSFFIGNSSSGLPFLGWIPYLYLYRRLVEDAEWEEIRRNPWQIFRRSPQVLYFDVGGGGHTIAVGQVTETDSAQAISHRKVKAFGQATETDVAQPITASGTKTIAVGQVAETDLAQAVASRKLKAFGQVTESDTAQAFSKQKLVHIGQVTETDTAQAITASGPKRVNVGQIVETDVAQAFARFKQKVFGQVTETDTAFAISKRKIRTVGQVEETDSALGMTIIGGISSDGWADEVATGGTGWATASGASGSWS